MMAGLRFSHCQTPQELSSCLLQVKPLDRDQFLQPHATTEGCYKFDMHAFNDISEFHWNQPYDVPELERQQRVEQEDAKTCKTRRRRRPSRRRSRRVGGLLRIS